MNYMHDAFNKSKITIEDFDKLLTLFLSDDRDVVILGLEMLQTYDYSDLRKTITDLNWGIIWNCNIPCDLHENIKWNDNSTIDRITLSLFRFKWNQKYQSGSWSLDLYNTWSEE